MIVLIEHPNANEVAKMLLSVANQVTPKFVAIRNYENNEGEVANYVINIGVDYGNAKNSDTELLRNKENFTKIDFGKLAMYADQARVALLEANLKPSNQSKAQTDAYTTIFENVRVHNDSGRVFVFGFKIQKTVLIKGSYKSVNSSDLTLAKDKIRETLRAPKFRQYALDKIKEVRMNGETIEFTL